MDTNIWGDEASYDTSWWDGQDIGLVLEPLFTDHDIYSFPTPQAVPTNVTDCESLQGDLLQTSLPQPKQSSDSDRETLGHNISQGTRQLEVWQSSSSPGGPGPQKDSLNPRVEERPPGSYNRFLPEQVEKLIDGVEAYGRRWSKIKSIYFFDTSRTKGQLKEKWRHMLQYEDSPTNRRTHPKMKELYARAKVVDAEINASQACKISGSKLFLMKKFKG